ncbi:MAG: conjugative transfer protein [Oscillospiraceae bacterium]|nr:conjugative transfer protein [Oscillospiraceae bacterium]MBQ7793900.1 conjugative transfer protein [Clostridia bacterium]
MDFFKDAIDTLQIVLILIGAGLGGYGIVNLLEAYGSDNAAGKSQGTKQLMAGIGIAALAFVLIPGLKDLIDEHTAAATTGAIINTFLLR